MYSGSPQNPTVTLRSSVFMVTNVNGIESITADSGRVLTNELNSLKKSFQTFMGLSNDVPKTQLLMKSVRVNVHTNQSPSAIVTMRNPEGHSTSRILDALKNVFKEFKGRKQIKVCTMLDGRRW